MINEVRAGIITIGDELLMGQTIDTNSAWIGRKLNELGIRVSRRVAIEDDPKAILNALAEERKLVDILLITGGLGPTDDDKTKAVLCDYFDAKMVWNEKVLAQVKKRVSSDGWLLERNKNQALVPDKCEVLFNARGTAPGLWFEKERVIYVALPGIPFEMEGLMEEEVLPRLNKRIKLPAILHRTQIVTGIPEAVLANKLESFERSLPAHIHLAYLPGNGVLKLRLTAKGEVKQKIAHQLDQLATVLENEIKEYLIAKEDIPIQQLLGEQLRKKKYSVATAESCTGGYIGHLLTSIAGSSDYFKGGLITYTNSLKQQLLHVSEKLLSEKGAVSEEVVKAMLVGVTKKLKTEVGIAVSGIMGPAGGSDDKPVGTVWIAAGNVKNLHTRKLNLRYNRHKNIEMTAHYALILLLDALKDDEK